MAVAQSSHLQGVTPRFQRYPAAGQSLAAGVREHGHVPRSGNFVPKRGTGTLWNIVLKCGGTRIIYRSNHRNVSPKWL
jgi:hypothetical protein